MNLPITDTAKAICYNCNHELNLAPGETVLRTELCPNCEVEIRCCRCCKFYDPQSYNECREPMAERITDKEKANYCEYFSLLVDKAKEEESKKSILSAAEALFKK